jgi:hypothetical protein
MIAEPKTLLSSLERLAKTSTEAARHRDALERAWRDYRWTVLEIVPNGDLSSRKWRDAYAFDLLHHGYGWGQSEFAVVYGEFSTGNGEVCHCTSAPRHDWPRYAATSVPVGVGNWFRVERLDSQGNAVPWLDNTKWESHAPVCSPTVGPAITFGTIEASLQTAITAAQQYLEGT